MLVRTRDIQADQPTAIPALTAPQRRAKPQAPGRGRESSSYQPWPTGTLGGRVVKAEARRHP